jgi:hypothetical protein
MILILGGKLMDDDYDYIAAAIGGYSLTSD